MPWSRAKTTVTNIRKTFLRPETDTEYAARLREAGISAYAYDGAAFLDRIGDARGLQRKLLEDVA